MCVRVKKFTFHCEGSFGIKLPPVGSDLYQCKTNFLSQSPLPHLDYVTFIVTVLGLPGILAIVPKCTENSGLLTFELKLQISRVDLMTNLDVKSTIDSDYNNSYAQMNAYL